MIPLEILSGLGIIVGVFIAGYCWGLIKGYKKCVDDYEFYERRARAPNWRDIK